MGRECENVREAHTATCSHNPHQAFYAFVRAAGGHQLYSQIFPMGHSIVSMFCFTSPCRENGTKKTEAFWLPSFLLVWGLKG
jgi:hypothetical protein